MLFVACVHKGKIILDRPEAGEGGQPGGRQVGLDQARSIWAAKSIVGRGYYSDHFYYLPVSGQQI